MSDSPIPKLPQIGFESLKPYPVTAPPVAGGGVSPTHATMPSENWMNLLPKAPTAHDAISAQEFALKMRLQGQKDQGYNALARLMSDPQNRAPGGGLNSNALAQLYGASPQIGMEYQGAQSEIAQRQQATATSAQKFATDEQLRLLDDFVPLDSEYTENLKKYGLQRADQLGQEHYTRLVEEARQSGSYSPQTLARLNPKFDINRLRANIFGAKGLRDEQRAERQDKRAEVSSQIAGSADARSERKEAREAAGEPGYQGTVNGERVPLIFRPGPPGPNTGYFDSDGKKVEGAQDIRPISSKDESAIKYGKTTQIEIEDPEKAGERKIVPAQQNPKTGEWVTADANRDPLPSPKRVLSGSGGPGRQAATQATAMVNAGNEVAGALANLVDLPITATSGWFMGVQTERPGALREALKRSLASTLTSDESKSVLVSFQGVARSMATLEAAGRATGLVGLTQQAQALMPQQGDSGMTVLRKYAEVRQLTERSIETMKASPDVSRDQQKLMDKILGEVKQSVPRTVRDINALERKPDDKTVQFFADKIGAAGKAAREGGASAASAGAPGAGVVKMGSDKQDQQRKWNAADPGTRFVFPDGTEAVKP